jgi:lipopolysaccharide biosynthesis glycosyltransferase
MTQINLLFATDNNYIEHVAVVLASVFDNNPNANFKIYYIIDEVSVKNKIKFESFLIKYNCKVEFLLIDCTIFNSVVLTHHFSKSVYFRLMMAELVKEDKILYLDADTIVLNNIIELYETSIENTFLAAVLDPKFNRHSELLMNINSKYFNSGVLLVNLNKWREACIFQKCLEYLDINKANIELADQDVLNGVLDGNFRILNPIYNQQVVFYEKWVLLSLNCYSKADILLALNNPVVVHFSGSYKPWRLRFSHKYKFKYWKYLIKTPFFYSRIFRLFDFLNIKKYI